VQPTPHTRFLTGPRDFVIGTKDDIPLHLYVMPAASLITDAKARNRVFEEVLRFNMEKSVPSVDAIGAVSDPAMAK
jgi:hypothetical protein